MKRSIQIISAPSILGLKPGGVAHLGDSLADAGLLRELSTSTVVQVPALNDRYSFDRDKETHCLNSSAIHDFSVGLIQHISPYINKDRFSLVLGGDCSILIGIMPALKSKGRYGLIFIDAHADFYDPSQSVTGEVADMDLGIVTGRGPSILSDINGLEPYVNDEDVIHIGQRDEEETKKYGSRDIKDSGIHCFDLQTIRSKGINKIIDIVISMMNTPGLDGYWIHFDTDVIDDKENPAVDYRLPGGLSFAEAGQLLKALIAGNKVTGMSVTIFNPELDKEGTIAGKISNCISRSLDAVIAKDRVDH